MTFRGLSPVIDLITLPPCSKPLNGFLLALAEGPPSLAFHELTPAYTSSLFSFHFPRCLYIPPILQSFGPVDVQKLLTSLGWATSFFLPEILSPLITLMGAH